MCVCSSSLTSPQPFLHQGLVFWKIILPRTGVGWIGVGGGFRMIQGH